MNAFFGALNERCPAEPPFFSAELQVLDPRSHA